MSGIAQSTYLIPSERIGAFIGDVQRAGLVQEHVVPKEEEFLFVLRSSKDGLHPCLSFWSATKEELFRKMDVLWLASQKDIAEQIDSIARKHGAKPQP
ncbi:MAG TPA: hypothetical protein VK985_09385 [Rariglobus sp.]|nr:hypothetical protein [Rariglobus sp.]